MEFTEDFLSKKGLKQSSDVALAIYEGKNGSKTLKLIYV
jgi:hypothetical protein